jgi:hypothetical protein
VITPKQCGFYPPRAAWNLAVAIGAALFGLKTFFLTQGAIWFARIVSSCGIFPAAVVMKFFTTTSGWKYPAGVIIAKVAMMTATADATIAAKHATANISPMRVTALIAKIACHRREQSGLIPPTFSTM